MKLLGLLLCVLSLAACSDTVGGKDKDKDKSKEQPVTEFTKAMSGTWRSECRLDQESQKHFIENLTLNANGTGSFTIEVFDNTNCTGNAIQTLPPETLSYTEGAVNGNTKQVFLTIKNETVEIRIQMTATEMTVTSLKGTVRYQRQGPPPENEKEEGPKPTEGVAAFEAIAVGSWVTQCANAALNDGTPVTYVEIVTISKGGKGGEILNYYTNNNCTGTPAGTANKADFTYVVDRYANGGGQITRTKNGQQDKLDIYFTNGVMTVASEQGNKEFKKIQ